MSFMDILGKIVDAVIKFFELKLNNKKEEKEKTKSEKKAEKQLEKDIKESTNAIYNNDDDKLNQILAKSLLIALCCSFIFGCKTKTVYIQSDREIKSITYQGVEGKFVPNTVMEELVTDALKWRSYEKESRK